MAVPGGDQCGHVAPLSTPVGGGGASVFQAQVREAGVPERKPDVSGDVPGFTVPRLPVNAAQEFDGAAGTVVPKQEVHDPGDRVRAVLRGRAVAKHFDATKSDGGDGREIRPLGPEGDPIAAVPVDHRGPVAALAVDEDQGVVRRQIAQHGRPHQGRGVADRLDIHGERRDHGAEPLIDGRATPGSGGLPGGSRRWGRPIRGSARSTASRSSAVIGSETDDLSLVYTNVILETGYHVWHQGRDRLAAPRRRGVAAGIWASVRSCRYMGLFAGQGRGGRLVLEVACLLSR